MMHDCIFTYVTFHRVRFARPISGHNRVFDGPASPIHWLFGPDSPRGEDGLRTRVSDIWGGAAFYSEISIASAVMDNIAKELPWTSETIEAWHALLCPIAHRGQVNWFGTFEQASQFVPVSSDPGGRLAVLTSAGFNQLSGEELRADMPRRIDFLANVDRVIDYYANLPGSLARSNFQICPLGLDGMTFTLWQDEAAMAEAAYRPGFHRTQLDRYKAEQTADRTSFTRARILRSTGTWDGVALAEA